MRVKMGAVSPVDESSEKPNVVVGMGPGGLITALELAKKGKKAVIFEHRTHFTRGQRVKLNDETMTYLRSLLKDDAGGPDFITAIWVAGNTIEISKLQDFLRKKLEQYHNNIEIKQSNSEKQIQIVAVDLPQNELRYIERDVETGVERVNVVAFQHLVAADGARHAIATLAGKGEKGRDFVEYEVQPRQVAQGTVHVELYSTTERKEHQRELNESDLDALKKYGWDKAYVPRAYVWPDSLGRKFYIAGEIPEIYLKLKGEALQKSLENWGQAILEKTYGYQKNEVGLNLYRGQDPIEKEKDKLKTTAFPVTLEHAVASVYDCSPVNPSKHPEHAFIQIGEASRSSNFHSGHGTNDAILDGITVARCLNQDNTFDIEALNLRHQSAQEYVKGKTIAFAKADRIKYTHSSPLHYENRLKELIRHIEQDMLPLLVLAAKKDSDKEYIKDVKDIKVNLKLMKSMLARKKYDALVTLSEDVFNRIHEKLLGKPEDFSRRLEVLHKPEVEVKAGRDFFVDDTTLANEIQGKSMILHQFRESAESLKKLKEYSELTPGTRLPVVKPDQTAATSFRKR